MSFDLRAPNGDLELGSDGDVALVRDTDKLAQDVIKVLNTTLGSDPFNISYGSSLTTAHVGQALDPLMVTTRTQFIISQALDQMIATQAFQRTIQFVSDAETIVDFEAPIVEQDSQDPRQFNISVRAISRDLTPLTIVLVIRI